MDSRRGLQTFPKDLFKVVEALIIHNGKRKVMGVKGGRV